MDVKAIAMFLNNGVELVLESSKETGLTQQHLNHALDVLETSQPRIVFDLESDGKTMRQVYYTKEIAFYQVTFGKPEESFRAFEDRVAKRLKEVEFNHNVKTIEISKEDMDRYFKDGYGEIVLSRKWLGRTLVYNNHLEKGEFEMISDKGDVI